jgi:hypothetical protein
VAEIGSKFLSLPPPGAIEAQQPMLNSPKVLTLRDTLARALTTLTTSADSVSDEQLREQVCAVVDDLKAAGWPPERAIVALKEIAMEAGLMQTRNVLSLKNRELDARDALLVKVVRLCIECYYDEPQVA